MNSCIKWVLIKKRIILVVLIFSFLIYSIVSLFDFFSPHLKTKKFDFEIFVGQSTYSIIENLYLKKLIHNKTLFKFLLILRNKSNQIKHGIFILEQRMSANQIIDVITSGHTKSIRLTIPEGFNNRQIADRLIKVNFFDSRDDFFQYASDASLLAEYGIPANSTEGYIFPDTYDIPIGYAKKKIMRYFLDHFLQKIQEIENFPDNNIKRHKLVTLASIIEREAKLKEEISLIAGVFANRLSKNYPLESCATIQYLLKKPRERLYYGDLKIKSPYNTYRNSGLPPGPISSPGLKALEAALYPQKTNYFFFVVRGDGGHIFSETLLAHNRAKKKYETFQKFPTPAIE